MFEKYDNHAPDSLRGVLGHYEDNPPNQPLLFEVGGLFVRFFVCLSGCRRVICALFRFRVPSDKCDKSIL